MTSPLERFYGRRTSVVDMPPFAVPMAGGATRSIAYPDHSTHCSATGVALHSVASSHLFLRRCPSEFCDIGSMSMIDLQWLGYVVEQWML